MSINFPDFGKSKKHAVFKEYVDGFDDIMYEIFRLNDTGKLDEYNKEEVIREYTQKIRDLDDGDRREYFRKIFESASKLENVSEK